MTCDPFGASGYPPSPCPHTGHPDIGTAIHGGTAFTGADLTAPILALVFVILVAALSLVLSHAFRREGR